MTNAYPLELSPYLEPSEYIDSDNPAVIAYAQRLCAGATDVTTQAVRLYYGVRDDIAYDPYSAFQGLESYRASVCLQAGRGFCIPKAALLAATARAVGVPARIGLADVRNHLASARLLELMRTDVFYCHGYTELYLGGQWVKATPAFNLSLCEKFRVRPLEFDGRQDSVFHPFDQDNRKHMEYLRDHGAFADVPVELLAKTFQKHYPHLMEMTVEGSAEGFEREAEAGA